MSIPGELLKPGRHSYDLGSSGPLESMTVICSNCGDSLKGGDAFCGTCGSATPGGTPVDRITGRPNKQGSVTSIGRPSRSEAPGQRSAAAVARAAFGEPRTSTQSVVRAKAEDEEGTVLPLRKRRTEPAQELPPAEPTLPDPASVVTKPAIAGPPVLASDLLRERNEPTEPGQTTLKRLVWVLGAVGLAAIAYSASTDTMMVAALVGTLLTAAILVVSSPMGYLGKAGVVFLLSVMTAVIGVRQQLQAGLDDDATLLAGATILLSGSLIFRSYYRAARLARLTVACGVVALGAWFVLGGGLGGLVMLEVHWQSWAPALSQVALGILAILAMLAFMEGNTRAGAHVWGYLTIVMYGIHVGSRLAQTVWPIGTALSTSDGAPMVAALTSVVGVAIASASLAQLWVGLYRGQRKLR